MISRRIKEIYKKRVQFIKAFNLFASIPPSTDEHDLRNEILSTRLFIFLLTLCLVVLLIYNSLISVIRTDILKTPSFQEYEQLYSKYSKTLTCPCKTIGINYTDILHINYTLHQVCTSIFITKDWISYLTYTGDSNTIYGDDFRSNGRFTFQALVVFCKLANRTVSDSLAEFLLNMYISATVTPLELFQSQILTFIDQFNSSITNNFLRSFDLVLSTTHTNAFYSGVGSQSAKCSRPFSIKYTDGTPLFVVPGLFDGCYIVKALLQSTLECFYSQTCIIQLQSHYNYNSTMNIKSLNASSKTKYSVHSTVQHLLNQLMIEEWNANDKYENYYNKCQPIECSYSYKTRNGIVYIITALLGLVGGLITVLKIVVPNLVKFIRRKKQPETSRNDFLKNPSLQKYEELYSKYPKTLTCPCKTIRINYTDILHINYTLHQVCTSIFITKDWISYLTYTGDSNTIYGDDFRSNGRFTFQALVVFCKLANRTVSDSLAEFLLNMYISATVTPLELFQSQILTFIDQFNSSITNNFLRTLDLVRSTTHTNALFSALRTNYVPYLSSPCYAIYSKSSMYSDCYCYFSDKCVIPSSIKNSNSTPLFVVPGLYDGCYIVEALLQSTLECFYSQTCIPQLQSYYNSNSTMNTRPLDISSKSKYSVHSTVQHLLNQLMIEEWNANDKYENYYNKCQPIECSYSYKTRNGIVYIITALLGLVGGLITVLKIVVPNLVKFIRRKKQPETSRNTCNQNIPFNTIPDRPPSCNPVTNSSLVCAVSVTFNSIRENVIEIFYFTPTIANSRPPFVETAIFFTDGSLYRHAFHECADCDIYEYAREFVAAMQSLPATAPTVVPQMHNLLVTNDTMSSIECYKGKDENQVASSCLSCSLDIDMHKNSTRTCDIPPMLLLKVNLKETITFNNKRTFHTINIQCARQHCPLGQTLDNMMGGNPNPTAGQMYRYGGYHTAYGYPYTVW
ncbi:unnamed protein product [Adineta steineri]|uniref:Uncharacterized protein n=2 Tax=Adineta steineri TaxID=433720 RepID=A0A814WH30_9BILA|nr:unnamed protein product [Adineta steineri]